MSAIAATLRRPGLLTGGAALFDQVLFAGGMFVLNILLARWLQPADYGAFTLAFVVFLLLGNLHTAVLAEPMLVYGAGRHRDRLRGYLAVLLYGHVVVSGVFAAALGVAALVASASGATALAGAFAGLAVATPGILLLWLARRVFYVTGAPERAAAGDAVFLVALLAGLWALRAADAVTPGLAFVVVGAAGLLAALVLLVAARPAFGAAEPTRASVLREHWEYGRWSVTAQAVMWSSAQAVLVLVPLVLGFAEAAAIAVVLNLFRPLQPVQQSAIAVLLPRASALAANGAGEHEVGRSLRRVLWPLAGSILLYGAVLTALAGPVMEHLYAGRYEANHLLVALVALVYATATSVQARTVQLKATGNVRLVPLVFGASAVFTLAFSVPAMLVAGAEGAVAVLAVSYLLAAAVATRLVQRRSGS